MQQRPAEPFVSNFAFLAPTLPAVAELGLFAERYLVTDPNSALYKLRLLVEELARHLALRHGIPPAHLFDLLKELRRRRHLTQRAADLCHDLRRAGNRAVHDVRDQRGAALLHLRSAHELCAWYVAAHVDPQVRPAPFRPPPPPPDPAGDLARAHEEQRSLAARLAALEAAGEAEARRRAQPRVLFSQTALAQLDALAEPLRTPLGTALGRYRDDPDAAVLRAFDQVADGKFRCLLLDGGHCAVVAVSPHHDVHLVSWLGATDDAQRWVRGRRVEVNAVLGSIQLYGEPPPAAPAAHGLLAAVSDDDLLRCGVPPLLVPAVRALRRPEELVGLGSYLPQEAADVLTAVADGQPLEAAIAEAGLRRARLAVDPADFDTAAGHQATQRAFAELDDRTFEEILQAPIEQWRVFLHPSQAKVVRARAQGPVRVLGGAGTGKTVALLHRVRFLVREELPDPADRLLVTTYSRTLASALRRHLQVLLRPDELERVTVSTLHAVARRLLNGAGRRFGVVSEATRDACWDAAIAREDPQGAHPKAFYLEEWDLVVQSQGVADQTGYFAASRQGRGTSLTRRDRAAIWRVFAAYRAELAARDRLEWSDVLHEARQLAAAAPPFRAVLVDEVQDFGAVELRLLRALAPRAPADLFLVGDAHQRIYKLGTTLAGCGIDIRGRSTRLKVNYRTTQRISAFAFGVLAGASFDDLDGGVDTLQGYRSLREGRAPEVRAFAAADEEQAAVVARVRAWLAAGVAPEAICVAARTAYVLRPYREALEQAGMRVVHLEDDEDEVRAPDAVRVSTMHRLKGTEFSRVVLAGVQEGVFPLPPPKLRTADEAALEDFLHQERCLMYVASTRARDELAVTGTGRMSPHWGR
ncbi:MAG: AAA family ATPase [Myxococcota bacterium]